MTPQLQQAIRLLQLSTLDLQQEVQMMLDSNPLLDEEEGVELAASDGPSPAPEERQLDLAAETSLPEELPVDSQWEDVFDMGSSVAGSATANDEDLPDFEARNSREQSLQDYLRWQANLTFFESDDRNLAELIIDAIDDTGYLGAELGELEETSGRPVAELEAILRRIQDFDPPGVAARSLAECLSLQLQQIEEEDDALLLARRIVDEQLELLANMTMSAWRRPWMRARRSCALLLP